MFRVIVRLQDAIGYIRPAESYFQPGFVRILPGFCDLGYLCGELGESSVSRMLANGSLNLERVEFGAFQRQVPVDDEEAP